MTVRELRLPTALLENQVKITVSEMREEDSLSRLGAIKSVSTSATIEE